MKKLVLNKIDFVHEVSIFFIFTVLLVTPAKSMTKDEDTEDRKNICASLAPLNQDKENASSATTAKSITKDEDTEVELNVKPKQGRTKSSVKVINDRKVAYIPGVGSPSHDRMFTCPMPAYGKASQYAETLEGKELWPMKLTSSGYCELVDPQEFSGEIITRKSFSPDNRFKIPGNRFKALRIFPPDNRFKINDTGIWPYHAHGKIYATFPNKKTYVGSGALVNPHHVLTAGHVIYDKELGGWAESATFVAGQRGTEAPFGRTYATKFISTTAWTEDVDPTSDFGMIILDRPPHGNSLGLMSGVTGLNNVNITGYPADKDDGLNMYQDYGLVFDYVSILAYTIDTSPGQSGGAIWSYWGQPDVPEAGFYCTGVHTESFEQANQGVNITRIRLERIVNWINSN